MTAAPYFIGIIPARQGSKGIPNKNAKLLGDKPLTAYTLESAMKSRLLNKVILSTDSPLLIEWTSYHFPSIVIHHRPAHLALDDTPTTAVLQDILDTLGSSWSENTYICLLQPTTPFRVTGLIDSCIEMLLQSKSDSLITFQKIPDRFHPRWAFELKERPIVQPILEEKTPIRRQDLSSAYYRDGQVYIIHRHLITQGKLWSNRLVGYINHKSAAINIDTPADWQEALNYLTNEYSSETEDYNSTD